MTHAPSLPGAIQALYPFRSRWMDVRGRRIHYLDEGEREKGKPVVLLLHGNPTWSFLYREIIPRLRPQCRVVAPDYLGFGLSEKPADERLYSLENHQRNLAEFIAGLGLKNLVMVVQDWGGPIGLGYAAAFPENVRGALIMNTWAWPEPSAFHAATSPWRMLHAPLLGPHFLLRVNALIERGLYLSVGDRAKMKPGSPVLDGYRFPYASPQSRIGILAFPRNIPLKPGDANWDRMARLREDLRTVDFPCRLLWGAKDEVFPVENAHLFREILKNCSMPRIIPEGRHFIQEDAPEEIAEEILTLVDATRQPEDNDHAPLPLLRPVASG